MKSIAFLLEGMDIATNHVQINERVSDFFLETFQEEIVVNHQKGKIFLQISPILRSELFLRREEVIRGINERIEEFNVKISKVI